mmetsp:Transcript_46007/g.133977  ORF Transcript_46007/g.133977 Transcript_46007/m.133977 type:complete len:285 (-) Transcript_46007:973-1827(-)
MRAASLSGMIITISTDACDFSAIIRACSFMLPKKGSQGHPGTLTWLSTRAYRPPRFALAAQACTSKQGTPQRSPSLQQSRHPCCFGATNHVSISACTSGGCNAHGTLVAPSPLEVGAGAGGAAWRGGDGTGAGANLGLGATAARFAAAKQQCTSRASSHQHAGASTRFAVTLESVKVTRNRSPLPLKTSRSQAKTLPFTSTVFTLFGPSHLQFAPICTNFGSQPNFAHWGGGFAFGDATAASGDGGPFRRESFGQSVPPGLPVGLWCTRMSSQSKFDGQSLPVW